MKEINKRIPYKDDLVDSMSLLKFSIDRRLWRRAMADWGWPNIETPIVRRREFLRPATRVLGYDFVKIYNLRIVTYFPQLEKFDNVTRMGKISATHFSMHLTMMSTIKFQGEYAPRKISAPFPTSIFSFPSSSTIGSHRDAQAMVCEHLRGRHEMTCDLESLSW